MLLSPLQCVREPGVQTSRRAEVGNFGLDASAHGMRGEASESPRRIQSAEIVDGGSRLP